MDEKPELICYSNYLMGGVASFWLNILSNDTAHLFEKKVIHLKPIPSPHTYLLEPYGICDEVIFEIDSRHNESVKQIAQRLSPFISNRPGIILANFTTELSALYFCPKKNKTVFYVCHDELYVVVAIKYEHLIDVFIVHNPVFYAILTERLPNKRKQDIHYLPYGVHIPEKLDKIANDTGPLKIVWLARIYKEKGIYDLPEIAAQLKEKSIEVEWTIIGNGPDKQAIQSQLNGDINFVFHSPLNYQGIFDLIKSQDIFILPSRLDGLPVAMLETMSVGCVPVVSRFNAGIEGILGDVGFVCDVGNNNQFVDAISTLHFDRNLMKAMSQKAIEKVNLHYDIKKQALKYFELFAQYKALKKPKRYKYVRHFSMRTYLPDFLLFTISKIKKYF